MMKPQQASCHLFACRVNNPLYKGLEAIPKGFPNLPDDLKNKITHCWTKYEGLTSHPNNGPPDRFFIGGNEKAPPKAGPFHFLPMTGLEPAPYC